MFRQNVFEWKPHKIQSYVSFFRATYKHWTHTKRTNKNIFQMNLLTFSYTHETQRI